MEPPRQHIDINPIRAWSTIRLLYFKLRQLYWGCPLKMHSASRNPLRSTQGIVGALQGANISRQNLSYNKKATYFIIVQFLAVGNQRIQCNSKPQSGATLI
jgi:hypothetical protein